MEPTHADALHYLGVLWHQEGRFSEAADLMARAVAVKPNDAAAHNNLGVAFEALGRLEEAVDAYDRAIAIHQDYGEALSNRGNALLGLGRPKEALASYDRALVIAPDRAEVLSNRGVALFRLLRYDDALKSWERALLLKPNDTAALNNQGSALLALQRAKDALASFDRALALDPRYAEALFNRGNALIDLGHYEEALSSYDLAIAFNPSYPKALNNRGNTLKDQGRLDEAVDFYRKALEIEPNYADAHSNLLFAQHYMDGVSSVEHLSAARAFGETFDIRASEKFPNDRNPDRRLRVGYVSGDFNAHPCGFFVTRVLEAHNHEIAEIFCYSNSEKYDSVTERFQRAAHHWRSLVGLADADAATLISRDRIDVLVDLSGHTARNRLPMFAYRPAPVQVSWQGYPGTTGLRAIDYLIMDEYAVLPGEERWYTEAIARLPYGRFCYLPPDYAPALVDPPVSQRNSVTLGVSTISLRSALGSSNCGRGFSRRSPTRGCSSIGDRLTTLRRAFDTATPSRQLASAKIAWNSIDLRATIAIEWRSMERSTSSSIRFPSVGARRAARRSGWVSPSLPFRMNERLRAMSGAPSITWA